MPHIESTTDTRNCQDEDEIEIPEADIQAILSAKKTKDMHTYFPEFEIIDVDEDWATRMREAEDEKAEAKAEAEAKAAADAKAVPTEMYTAPATATPASEEPATPRAVEPSVIE